MTYRMNSRRYEQLRANMSHSGIVDMLNGDMRQMNIKQKGIIAEDSKTGEKQDIHFESIGLKPMQVITDVAVY